MPFPAFAAEQANVVLILCDDLGYGDQGITGHPCVKSPHIDSLATQGFRIENGYMSGTWEAAIPQTKKKQILKKQSVGF